MEYFGNWYLKERINFSLCVFSLNDTLRESIVYEGKFLFMKVGKLVNVNKMAELRDEHSAISKEVLDQDKSSACIM